MNNICKNSQPIDIFSFVKCCIIETLVTMTRKHLTNNAECIDESVDTQVCHSKIQDENISNGF